MADHATTLGSASAAGAGSRATPDPPKREKKKRSAFGIVLRVLSFLIATIALLLVLALGGLWVWSGAEGSLRQALELAARFVPLQSRGVTGSIRGGGQVDYLNLNLDGLKVEVNDAFLKWQPTALLDKTIKLNQLSAGKVKVEDNRAPKPAEPSTGPPQSLKLPVKIELDRFALNHFDWVGPPPVNVDDIMGSYVYDGQKHTLNVDGVKVMNGSYQAKATLSDSAPIMLDAKVTGKLQTDVPGGGAQDVGVTVEATAQGPLTDLKVAANAQAQVGATDGAAPARANVTARVTPWAEQPLPQADATFSEFDAGALWPAAPRTQLTGELHVKPTTAGAGGKAGWQLEADLNNALAGPWDKKRLPLQSLQAAGAWQDGTATIEQLQAKIGGGTLRAQGKWISPPADPAAASAPAAGASAAAPSAAPAAGTGDWRIEATLDNINPAALDSQLAALPIDGKATARGEGAAIDFDVALRTDPNAKLQRVASPAAAKLGADLRQLKLREAKASGRWNDGQLSLSALEVRTDDAKLSGTVNVDTKALGGQGQLRLTAPGLDVKVDGELRETAGAGVATIAANDVSKVLDWAGRLPGVPDNVKQANASGRATLTARWKGGWRDPALDLKLDAPKLDYVPPPSLAAANPGKKIDTSSVAAAAKDAAAQTIRLRDFDASLSGKLSQADLKVNGRAELGARKLDLNLAASGGRVGNANKPLAESAWQGKLTKLDAAVRDPALGDGPWRLALGNEVGFKWAPTPGSGSFETTAGKAVLSAPPGRGGDKASQQASIEWDPVRWRDGELTTKGKLSGVPMAWAELASGGQLAGGRVSGDMVFNGDWDVALGKKLDVKANLYRASGDLNILLDPEAGQGSKVAAGVKDARLSIRSDSGGDLKLDLNWQTDRAGQMNGSISTKLAKGADGNWKLATDAPLAGNLKVSLPKLGIWSRLAPPGWRLEGAIDTDVRMAGTLAKPGLAGTITADDLALRSIVEGFEFTGGKLRAKVDGQRLVIDEFTLQGAGAGAAGKGGSIGASGTAELVGGKPQAKLTITLDQLRPSIRTDADVTLSGQIQAALSAEQIANVSGTLKVDRARIELPEDSAPTLGSDVVVRRSGVVATGSEAAAKTVPVKASGNAVAVTTTAADPASKLSVKLDVKIDLGNDFRVSGLGLDSGLKGELAVVDGATIADPRVTGTIRTADGRFRAYGQKLDIDRGVIRFTGKPTNPSLDILALRSNMVFSDVKVGVQITGTAVLPQVSLYSEPDLPENQKLSWLVLGRATASSGAEAALLQTAAVALLSGKNSGGGIAGKFGLDELSLGESKGGTGDTAVTLGKRFSKNFYAAYERSLSGAVGTLFLFYDLSKRVTLRGATGERSALDLIYTLKYD